jgi:hypothetical protein
VSDWGWPQQKSAQRSWVPWIGVAILAVLGSVYFFRRTAPPPAPEPSVATQTAAPTEAPPPAVPTAVPPPAQEAPAQSAPAASEAAPAAPAPASAEGKTVVTINVKPADARFFRKGKPVGTSPFTVELAPGEKQTFEVGKPGFSTRKMTVDGSQTNLSISLKPEAPAPPATPASPPAQ